MLVLPIRLMGLLIVYSQYGEVQTNANDPWSQVGINVSSYVGQILYVSFTYTRLPEPILPTSDLAIDLLEVIMLYLSISEFINIQ